MTQGDANFSMAFSHHQAVGDLLQRKMLDRTVW
jgi:hypothetical protein